MSVVVSASLCQSLINALGDRTRGLIFHQLVRNKELTATMIAERLNLAFTNVSYHLRRLLDAGIVEQTREVIAGYRVEKYYRIVPELMSQMFATPQAITEAEQEMTPEQRQLVISTRLAIAANVLFDAARRYQSMDPKEFNRVVDEQRLYMMALGSLPRDRLETMVELARTFASSAWRELDSDTVWSYDDAVIFAALPNLNS